MSRILVILTGLLVMMALLALPSGIDAHGDVICNPLRPNINQLRGMGMLAGMQNVSNQNDIAANLEGRYTYHFFPTGAHNQHVRIDNGAGRAVLWGYSQQANGPRQAFVQTRDLPQGYVYNIFFPSLSITGQHNFYLNYNYSQGAAYLFFDGTLIQGLYFPLFPYQAVAGVETANYADEFPSDSIHPLAENINYFDGLSWKDLEPGVFGYQKVTAPGDAYVVEVLKNGHYDNMWSDDLDC